jgi:hypothetical protein
MSFAKSKWATGSNTAGLFKTVFLDGSNGIACSDDEGLGLYYTTNSGQTW